MASGASADVIHLKNGRTIWADHVNENGAHVEYDVGEDSYAIPKTRSTTSKPAELLLRLHPQGTVARAPDVPAFAPKDSLKNDSGLTDKIIRDHKVDPDALAALELSDSAPSRRRVFHRRQI